MPQLIHSAPLLAALAAVTGGQPGCAAEADRPETAERGQALIGGEIDYGDEAVVFINTAGRLCTGTLVSPSVIATAAHCVDDVSADPNSTIFFGTDGYGEGLRVGVLRSRVHPEWNGNVGAHDVGVLLMLAAHDPELAIPLNTSPVSFHVGEPIRRVGFGVHDRDTGELDGLKRQGTTVLHTVPAGTDYFFAGDSELSTCSGDSGGPAFLTVDGTEYLAGIHSFGYEGCVAPDNGSTRVDLYGDSFILPWIQDNDPACGEDGLCSRIGCTGDPDCEPCGAEGSCTADCPLPDPDCATSEIGEICRADTQCVSGMCVYWRGDPQSKYCTRECDRASDDCPAGMSCQSLSPFGDICYFDDDPAGVLGDDCERPTDCGSYICEDGTCVTECDVGASVFCPTDFECSSLDGNHFYCHALDTGGSGGCSIRGTADSRTPPLVVLLAAIWAWRSSGSSRVRRRGSSRRRCGPNPGS